MPGESFIQVHPDNALGKKVRTRSTVENGQVVEQQIVIPASRYGDFESLVDAFGRARISLPFAVFDSKHMVDKLPLYYDEATTGGGVSSHDAPNAQVIMAVGGGTDSVIRQSKMRFVYQPGRSQQYLFTGLFTAQTNVRKRVGCYDGSNGIFMEVLGTGPSFNIIKNGSITETVPQSNWNLDKLDGTGPSGITLDLTAVQIVAIDFEWLGTGPVRCGFFIDGIPVYVHKFQHGNQTGVTSVYMSQPNQAVRYEITSQGGAGSMAHICSNVVAEGGQEFLGITYSVDMGANQFTLPATGIQALMGFRLKSTPIQYLSASVLPTIVHLVTTANANVRWCLVMNPTIAGAALSWSDITNASIQRALGISGNTITGGTQIDSGYLGAQDRVTVAETLTRLRMGVKIDGTPDVLVLGCEVVTGSNVGMVGAVQFAEWL